MRRIIERKVTVVTTTTWTISWETDPPQPDPQTDPVHPAESNTDALPAARTAPNPATVIEIKEADSEDEEKPTEPQPPFTTLDSYPSNSERK